MGQLRNRVAKLVKAGRVYKIHRHVTNKRMGMDCRNNQTAIDVFTSPLFHKHQNRSGSNNFKYRLLPPAQKGTVMIEIRGSKTLRF